MSERRLRGLGASAGIAAGPAAVVREAGYESVGGGPDEERRALAALADVAADLGAAADRLRERGFEEEAKILEANRLMAEDPSLTAAVLERASAVGAVAAVRAACEHHAELLEALTDSVLAARAADVRQLGLRAERVLTGARAPADVATGCVLVARELGPADVAELPLGIGGIALAAGAATSHAAIVARSLGVPMAVALGDELFAVADGAFVVLDGDTGVLTLEPDLNTIARVGAASERALRQRGRQAAARALPAATIDGRPVRLLANASSPAEVRVALDAAAEGIGLVRTELAFLEAAAWPNEAEHEAALTPVLSLLDGRIATVRTLDFGADKTPPFLSGIDTRGLALMLEHEGALSDQLRAIVRAGAGTQLRVLLPLVEEAAQLRRVRALLQDALEAAGWRGAPPALGAMIETPQAAARATEIALEADFLSVGTNDLVQYTLGLDRELPLATARAAADPAVLAHISATVVAARRVGIPIEVCGEAAAEPPVAALLIGFGVDELSVAPARVDEIRVVVQRLSAEAAAQAAGLALSAGSAAEALALGEALLDERDDERGQVAHGGGGVFA
jgi:phosphoenolpyruvate-protein kinase (PTS system EI component)